MGSPPGPESVGDRQKVGLEDRFQHHPQGLLHDPVGDRRDPQRAGLPSRFRDQHPTHGRGPIRAVLERGSDPSQERPDLPGLGDLTYRDAIDPRRAGPLVVCHMLPSHQQVDRVTHQVEQVPEPRRAVGLRPTVILDLRPRYPFLDDLHRRTSVGVHRRHLRHRSTSYPSSLPPFPMCPALPDSQYYGGSASPHTDRWTTHPATTPCWRHGLTADARAFPCSLAARSPKEASGYLPAATSTTTP